MVPHGYLCGALYGVIQNVRTLKFSDPCTLSYILRRPLHLRTLHVHFSPQNTQTHTHLGNISSLTFYNDLDYELRITCFFIKKIKREDLFYFEICHFERKFAKKFIFQKDKKQ